MNLQAKLTLGSVVLGVLMVSVISAMDFGNYVQQQFEATLQRAVSAASPQRRKWW